jgi:hypothetical protein
LWVHRYAAPGDTVHTWEVFRRGEEFAGVLQVPRRFAIRDVSGDRVAGVWTDDMGVETVRVYRLVRSSLRRPN